MTLIRLYTYTSMALLALNKQINLLDVCLKGDTFMTDSYYL